MASHLDEVKPLTRKYFSIRITSQDVAGEEVEVPHMVLLLVTVYNGIPTHENKPSRCLPNSADAADSIWKFQVGIQRPPVGSFL